MRTLVIEDEPAVRKEIEWLVNQEQEFSLLGTASNVHDALILIKATKPELVLMDIQLADGTAFDILNSLPEISFNIIFITAYNHFAIKAIKYGALDYLLKPLDETELKSALQKIKFDSAGQTIAVFVSSSSSTFAHKSSDFPACNCIQNQHIG